MRKNVYRFTLFVLTVCMALPLSAQNAEKRWGLGIQYTPRGVEQLFDGVRLNNLDLNHAARLHFSRYVLPAFDLGFATSFVPGGSWSSIPGPKAHEFVDGEILATIKFNNGHILKEMAKVAPYLQTGFGAHRHPGDLSNLGRFSGKRLTGYIPLGAGFKWQLAPEVNLDFGAVYKFSLNDAKLSDYFSPYTGVTFNFGKGDKKPKPEPEPVKAPDPDRDQDGIIDAEDQCPDIAGLAQYNGCPDTDADGLADNVDGCPTQPGPKDNNGCPVEEKDSDNDGIMDGEDNCPNTPGLAQFKGCPDKDNDGVMDKEDNCPDVAGLVNLNGCPDKDNDGITDKEDDCPDVAGLAQYKGCPDTDGDGILDKDDKCPNTPGVAAQQGCPEIKEEVKETLEFAMKSVQFESAKATLKQSSYSVLDEIVKVMQEYPNYSLKISGHTDSRGDAIKNQTLSMNRALSCQEYLIKKGVDPTRLSAAGYGESRPIADNMNEAGRKQNRRVEFELYLK